MKLIPINEATSILLHDDGGVHICQIGRSKNPLGRDNDVKLTAQEVETLIDILCPCGHL